jgi:hypothetical protein
VSRSFVRTVIFEKRQHVFRAIRRPCRKQTMVPRRKRATAMPCDKPVIPHASGCFKVTG